MDRNRKILVVVILASIIVGVGLTVPFGMIPAENYGNIVLYNERTDVEMDASTVLSVQDGDFISAQLQDDPATDKKPTERLNQWVVALFMVSESPRVWIENGGSHAVYPHISGNSLRWWFYLEACPEGTFEYEIEFFVDISETTEIRGSSHTFLISNSEEPVYDDAEFVTTPDDGYYGFGASAEVWWRFSYQGPCTVTVTLDDGIIESQDYVAGSGEIPYLYTIDTTDSGSHTIIFTVTPESDANSPISDTMMVTVGEQPTTPTTTDTTTTTTTTTTTITTEDRRDIEDEAPPDFSLLFIAAGVAVLLMTVIVWRRR